MKTEKRCRPSPLSGVENIVEVFREFHMVGVLYFGDTSFKSTATGGKVYEMSSGRACSLLPCSLMQGLSVQLPHAARQISLNCCK